MSDSHHNEIWKPVIVEGFEGVYSISSIGRLRCEVKRGRGNRCYPGKIMTPQSVHHGYHQYVLQKDGKSKHVSAHGLVLEHFVCPRPKGKWVNHKNGVTNDNRVCNLEWVTPRENVMDAIKRNPNMLRGLTRLGSQNNLAKLCESDIPKIRRLLVAGMTCATIAIIFGVNRTAISSIKHGRTWAHI